MERASGIDIAIGGDGGNFIGPGREEDPINVRVNRINLLFIKAALSYARMFPNTVRRCIEFIVLMKALCTFAFLIYIHLIFSRAPATCLDKVRSAWPRDGILRVEIIKDEIKDSNIAQFDYLNILLDIALPQSSINQRLIDIQPSSDLVFTLNHSKKFKTLLKSNVSIDNNLKEIFKNKRKNEKSIVNNDEINIRSRNKIIQEAKINSIREYFIGENLNTYDSPLRKKSVNKEKVIKVPASDGGGKYIVEFSLEDGLLRLSPETRKKLNIAVMTVTLDPSKDSCFGDKFSRFILRELIGYKDLILSSIKTLAEDEGTKGYMRNVITGEHYKLVVSMWLFGSAYIQYIAAFFCMIVFTISISLLLQCLIVVADIFDSLEFNVAIIFSETLIILMLTVILAFIGMEVLTCEFSNDITTAFFITLIVCIADQYDAICCHTYITKKYWLRFFYLYHFAFFAYHYRFNGPTSNVALITSWFFIEHSMIYFFHHYELPMILHQAHLQLIRAQATSSTQTQDITVPTQDVTIATQDNTIATQETNSNDNNLSNTNETDQNRIIVNLLYH